MKTLLHSIFIVMVLTSACMAASKNLKKAEGLVHDKMFLQAKEILGRETARKSASIRAQVYFLLGTCDLHLKNYSDAENSFKKALILKPDYSTDIALEYKDAGLALFRGNEVEPAIPLFDAALSYQPATAASIAAVYQTFGDTFLKKDDPKIAKQLYDNAMKIKPALKSLIVDTIFHYGVNLLNSKPDKPEDIFNLTVYYDPSYSQKVCDAYFDGIKAASKVSVDFLNKAMKCSDHSDEEIIRALSIKYPGGIMIMNVKAGEIDDVGMVRRGQEVHYLYADHIFEHRIRKAYNRGWGDPAWNDPADQGDYNVVYSGMLQIKTDERPLKVILSISE